MKEFIKLTKEQQTLFGKLEKAILNQENEKSVEDILEGYEPENKGSKNGDIEAVFTAFQEGELVKQGCVSEKYTLSALVVQEYNVEALKQILSAVGKIDGLKKKILNEVQFKGFDGKDYTLLNYAELYARSNQGSQNEENAAKEIVKIIQNMKEPNIQVTQKPQDQADGAGAPNGKSNTNESNNLTQEQKRRLLSFDLDNAIATQKGVAGILEQYKSENEDSYAEDIEAVLTAFSPSGFTLPSTVVYWKNPEALEDILNAARNIEDLEKKILTEVQYKNFGGKDCTLLDYAELYISSNEENPANKIVKIIKDRMIERGFPIPQNQAAGPDNSPKSPSFLSQNKGKFAIIGAVALVGTIAAFMSGYPIIGIIIALTATFMLATDKGHGMCDKVSSQMSGMFPQSAQQQGQPTNP
ncbi:MAG: hypothetical protein PG981_001325 [Wolbachia endosymbiont of Ctenocephalides orientis wCori]|nr:MAG: hypothetical protein PG981_001325 [Wolbachia endosymbiont of Ctenocephalides orientis wCori]